MHTWSDTKKTRLTLQLGNQEWEGRDKETAIEHVLTCHSVTRLSLIALLSTSGHVFKYRRIFILGQKMSNCKSEQRANIKFLVKLKKSATETFQLWNLGIYVWSGNQATINVVEVNIISKTKKSTHESFKVQSHVDFLWYPGYCDGRVGTQWPDSKLAV